MLFCLSLSLLLIFLFHWSELYKVNLLLLFCFWLFPSPGVVLFSSFSVVFITSLARITRMTTAQSYTFFCYAFFYLSVTSGGASLLPLGKVLIFLYIRLCWSFVMILTISIVFIYYKSIHYNYILCIS